MRRKRRASERDWRQRSELYEAACKWGDCLLSAHFFRSTGKSRKDTKSQSRKDSRKEKEGRGHFSWHGQPAHATNSGHTRNAADAPFEFFSFLLLNLFRISCFGFRIFTRYWPTA